MPIPEKEVPDCKPGTADYCRILELQIRWPKFVVEVAGVQKSLESNRFCEKFGLQSKCCFRRKIRVNLTEMKWNMTSLLFFQPVQKQSGKPLMSYLLDDIFLRDSKEFVL